MGIRNFLLCLAITAAPLGAESDERAMEWLRKAQQAAGGVERLAAIHDVEIRRNVQTSGFLQSFNGSQTVQYVLPSTLKQINQFDFGRMVVFVSGDEGWIDGLQGFMAMPEPQLRQAKGEVFRLREALLLADRDPTRTVRFIADDEQEGRAAAELEIASKEGDQTVRVWIDADSGDLFRVAYEGVAVQGSPPQVVELYGDFRSVEGVRVPFRTTISQNGRALSTSTISDVKWNPGLTAQELAER